MACRAAACRAAAVIRAAGGALAAWVCAVFLPAGTLFALHPALMAVGFGVLFAEGVFAAVGLRSVAGKDRVPAIQYHMAVSGAAVLCVLVGFYAIYANKNRSEKPHFVSWHGLGGLATVALMVGSHAGGVFSFRALGFMPLLPDFLQTRIKGIHRLAGSVTFLGGCASLVSGFLRPNMARGGTTWAWVALTLINLALFVRAVLAPRSSAGKPIII
mgnify:FL=1